MQDSGEVNSKMTKEQLIEALGVQRMSHEQLMKMSENTAVDTLTVNFQFYHQAYGQNPDQFDAVFSKPLSKHGEPIKRRLKIKSGEAEIDPGWAKPEDVGYLFVRHLMPSFQMSITEDQMQEIKQSRIVVEHKGEPLSPMGPDDMMFLPVENIKDFKIKVIKGASFSPPYVEYVLLPG